MDVARARPYVRTAMELLLALLSLLTATTGAVSGARAPEAGAHHASAGIVAAAPARRATPRQAPVALVSPERNSEAPVAAPATPPYAAAPLATDRLIE